jgi:23S rRNA pseudouridine1911/1915/1917 synthase
MGTLERSITLEVPESTETIRIDSYIASQVPGLTRSLVGSDTTVIMVDGKKVKKSHKVSIGEIITVQWSEVVFSDIIPQDIPLYILHEDESILVIDKQQSLVVHPAAGNPDGTLVNALVFKYGLQFSTAQVPLEDDEPDENAVVDVRPGIVHRLDKDTSGVMVVAKSREAHVSLAAQFKDHTATKHYIAIVKGTPSKRRGKIIAPLIRDPKDRKRFTTTVEGKGKNAETDYVVLRYFEGYSLLRIRLHTGRTHQIRVHLQHIGNPILGDSIYTRQDTRFGKATLMLHALSLEIDHPYTGVRMLFRAPMPDRFKDAIAEIKKIRTRRFM